MMFSKNTESNHDLYRQVEMLRSEVAIEYTYILSIFTEIPSGPLAFIKSNNSLLYSLCK